MKKKYDDINTLLARKIKKACDEYMTLEAYNTAAGIGGVESQKILYLNAIVLAKLTRDKVEFTKAVYDILEGKSLNSANAYYLSPDDEFFLKTPRDEILSNNNELYKKLK
jgi:coproporphyrinogen III oxidase